MTAPCILNRFVKILAEYSGHKYAENRASGRGETAFVPAVDKAEY